MKTARRIFGISLTIALVAAFGFCFFATAKTFSKLKVSALADAENHAILASSTRKASLILPVSYWQQTPDSCANQYDTFLSDSAKSHQFEWTKCDYYREALEQNLVKSTLGSDNLPVFNRSGNYVVNRGINEASFYRWFHSTDTSVSKSGILQFEYSSDDDSYHFDGQKFQPLGDNLFTMSLVVPFYATAESKISLTADDDTWIFLNSDLIIDLGGVHEPISQDYNLPNDGILRVFHANRDSSSSVFSLRLSHAYINMADPLIAGNDSDYAVPLGETSSYAPGRSRAIVATITIELCVLFVLVLVAPFIIKFALKRR